ncbi:MAG: M14 family zinc carboxypeptidase, partial [Cyclobacteriaceae bacterium]
MIGKSVEQRNLYRVSAGIGKTQVLLWSQMHGNEPTATMALMDIFRFLDSDPLANKLLQNLRLHFIPMLNPD